MPVSLIAELLNQHRGLFVLAMAAVVVLAIIVLRPRTVSQRRHRRYQKQAARALLRLPQLRDEAARIAWLRKMNPYVFEEMLLTALSRQGLRIQRNDRYSGDNGSDGQVWINGRRWLIQAKRYSATISAAHVSAFGLLSEREGCPGLFVHTGRTGEVSREAFRHYNGIMLISGQRLLWLLAGDRRWMDTLNRPQYSPIIRQHYRKEPTSSPIIRD
ncbi:restriction endonuclease [Pantoea cypripedii]|uniref:Restriction endonuclease n=1 Tax=Pantoea cypripedii TaxID=55209 RepID=A0A1X1EN60_PANCY|nr:restriction endonuclease [Pantoea cypripedii]MBP2195059.1 restriction system protein [Pantoea cypripedii]ORM90204.1 restriction endonuclease [Pantoea cypripedii]